MLNTDRNLTIALLEYDKSSFLLELVQHTSGVRYVEVRQIIRLSENEHESHVIKINPTILGDVIEVLSTFKKLLPSTKRPVKLYFSAENKKQVISRYLKGVDIPDLALQFDCAENIIYQILFNAGIEIVSNKLPKQLQPRSKRLIRK
jgi:hypothetical protein